MNMGDRLQSRNDSKTNGSPNAHPSIAHRQLKTWTILTTWRQLNRLESLLQAAPLATFTACVRKGLVYHQVNFRDFLKLLSCVLAEDGLFDLSLEHPVSKDTRVITW